MFPDYTATEVLWIYGVAQVAGRISGEWQSANGTGTNLPALWWWMFRLQSAMDWFILILRNIQLIDPDHMRPNWNEHTVCILIMKWGMQLCHSRPSERYTDDEDLSEVSGVARRSAVQLWSSCDWILTQPWVYVSGIRTDLRYVSNSSAYISHPKSIIDVTNYVPNVLDLHYKVVNSCIGRCRIWNDVTGQFHSLPELFWQAQGSGIGDNGVRLWTGLTRSADSTSCSVWLLPLPVGHAPLR